jgi:ribosomal protein S12 methylthiotransferase accessory factor
MFTITFPGGVAVEAEAKGVRIRTDQPPPLGPGTSMSPFDLFLASIGTCAGFYALRFCQERGIATDGLGLRLEAAKDPQTRCVPLVEIELSLPDGFPEKYRDAILRAVDQCTVKRHLAQPPAIEVAIAEALVPVS